MTRGFITIATGKKNFYKIAANLVHSYRYYSASPLPFAIICDEENEYTQEFDKTIIIGNPKSSYVDKLRLPELVPYDETIFIDADCLAYKDLNDFWKAFDGASPFSAFGTNYPLDYQYGWFKRENVGEYKDRVTYIPEFVGGVYYLKKCAELDGFYATAQHIESTYGNYTFRQFTNVSDETVNALAMSVCGFKTADAKSPDVCFYPLTTHFESDISKGTVAYRNKYAKDRGTITGAYMVHWGSGNTALEAYQTEVYRLNCMCKGKPIGKAEMFAAKLRITSVATAKRTCWKLLRALKSRSQK